MSEAKPGGGDGIEVFRASWKTDPAYTHEDFNVFFELMDLSRKCFDEKDFVPALDVVLRSLDFVIRLQNNVRSKAMAISPSESKMYLEANSIYRTLSERYLRSL